MKRLKLLFLGLCLAVISAQAQVVFSEAEKNFVVSQVTTPIQDAATTFTTNHDASCLKFKPSRIRQLVCLCTNWSRRFCRFSIGMR